MLYCHMNRERNLPSLSQSNRVIHAVFAPNISAPIASRAPRCAVFLCESPRDSAPLRYPFLPLRRGRPQPAPPPIGTASCNKQLQLHAFLRSVDYRGLMSNLSPFKINTSKNSCTFYISPISGHLKSPIISTSRKNDRTSSRINTSKKTGGGGPVATRHRFHTEITAMIYNASPQEHC
jgi:hypothetical protein